MKKPLHTPLKKKSAFFRWKVSSFLLLSEKIQPRAWIHTRQIIDAVSLKWLLWLVGINSRLLGLTLPSFASAVYGPHPFLGPAHFALVQALLTAIGTDLNCSATVSRESGPVCTTAVSCHSAAVTIHCQRTISCYYELITKQERCVLRNKIIQLQLTFILFAVL